MFSLPQFGAIYVPEKEFSKLPSKVGFTEKILSRIENTDMEQKAARCLVRNTLEHALGVRVGVTTCRDGIILSSTDDGPPGREPMKDDVFVARDQSRITNYLDAHDVDYAESN
jgi:hypothetical protein